MFDKELLNNTKAWPFVEARKLLSRVEKTSQKEVIFETGYGPSGLPHIGTFGEVARTSMVRHAFSVLTDNAIPTKLLAFSDDLDALRAIPENIPNKDMLSKYIGMSLSRIPDPFGTHESYAHHNNARLKSFLDRFEFEYEFASASEYYKSGIFNNSLSLMLKNINNIMRIMIPTLGEKRAATYCPFLPIHPETGEVMQVPIVDYCVENNNISWIDPISERFFKTSILDGNAKLQWKPDWAMRWHALKIDYEMAGKDLIDSVKLSSAINQCIGGNPPDGFNYELFLDSNGKKISKSLGNGLTIDQWLQYGSTESLKYFMYQRPREAKKLHIEVIPRAMDDFISMTSAADTQDTKSLLGNPVWYISNGKIESSEVINGEPISFALLLNLAAVANSDDSEVLWGFLKERADVNATSHPKLASMVENAINYYRDFVKPQKNYRLPTDDEKQALEKVIKVILSLDANVTAQTIQFHLYEIARSIPLYQNLNAKGSTPERPGVSNEWFKMMYQVLFGENSGPRMGSFIYFYGINRTCDLIKEANKGSLANEITID